MTQEFLGMNVGDFVLFPFAKYNTSSVSSMPAVLLKKGSVDNSVKWRTWSDMEMQGVMVLRVK